MPIWGNPGEIGHGASFAAGRLVVRLEGRWDAAEYLLGVIIKWRSILINFLSNLRPGAPGFGSLFKSASFWERQGQRS
jgi:hypothetical protein